MRTASVSELKAHLSRHLREARDGDEIQILHRGVPIARIVPPEPSWREARQKLIEKGILRPGTGNFDAILKRPPLRLPTDLSGALDEDREDRV